MAFGGPEFSGHWEEASVALEKQPTSLQTLGGSWEHLKTFMFKKNPKQEEKTVMIRYHGTKNSSAVSGFNVNM